MFKFRKNQPKPEQKSTNPDGMTRSEFLEQHKEIPTIAAFCWWAGIKPEELKKLMTQKEHDCSDCHAWSGTDCKNNPYLDGCLKDPNNDEWLNSPENPEHR